MKVYLFLLALFLEITTAQAGHYKVILLGGQSNSVGQSSGTALPTSPINLQQPQSDIPFYFFNTFGGEALTTLQPGSGGSVGSPPPPAEGVTENTFHFGPEISFGRTVADANPDENYAIIKHGENGTSLAHFWFPNPGSGPSYTRFQDTVADGLTALKKAGHTTEVAGMLWMQGETDAFDSVTAAAYEARLTAFIAHIRSLYGKDLPFVIGEITRSFVLKGIDHSPGLNTVADAQIAVAKADPHSGFAQGSDLVFFDNIHFDGPSTITLGERMAAAFLKLTDNSGTITSSPELAPSKEPTDSQDGAP